MNSAQNNTLRLPSPCPMTMNRLKKDDGFHCNSCKKDIVDFRNKTDEEIIAYLKASTQNPCGIFREEQVSVPTYSWKSAFLFKALTVLAFIGFNVSPMSAQATIPKLNTNTSNNERPICPKNNGKPSYHKNTTQKSDLNKNEIINEERPSKRKGRRVVRGRIKYTPIGCPSF